MPDVLSSLKKLGFPNPVFVQLQFLKFPQLILNWSRLFLWLDEFVNISKSNYIWSMCKATWKLISWFELVLKCCESSRIHNLPFSLNQRKEIIPSSMYYTEAVHLDPESTMLNSFNNQHQFFLNLNISIVRRKLNAAGCAEREYKSGGCSVDQLSMKAWN